MIILHSNNIKKGSKIIFLNEPYSIEHSEFVKPGKGQAFIRVKLRNLISGKLLDKTFKATDYFNAANVHTTSVIYIYKDQNNYFFMDKQSFEQFSINQHTLRNNYKWIVEQNEYSANIWNNKIISISINNFVILKVINITNAIKGNSINPGNKMATLSTGAVVKIPLFIKIGDLIKIDTRSEEYVSRIKIN
ncbi:Elongation factor P [Buchnera aphidicola (Thelaxes suberi)]|uniref:elongation factor P n=1 Tax=Buchnera aphidicola TaxID=9 RepID=UPI003464D04E